MQIRILYFVIVTIIIITQTLTHFRDSKFFIIWDKLLQEERMYWKAKNSYFFFLVSLPCAFFIPETLAKVTTASFILIF